MSDLISRQAAIEMLNDNELERQADDVFDGDLHRYKRAAQRIIAQLPTIDAVPVGAYEQTRWERDTAIEQLEKIGKSLCEKMDNVATVVRCKDCKHRDAENGFCKGRGWPMQLVPDNGFCDKGEKS